MVGFPKYKSYKDSEVEWLGEIPSNWLVKAIKHTSLINPSGDRAQKDEQVTFLPMEAVLVNGQYDVFRVDIRNTFPASLTEFNQGDVLLAKITPCFENGKGAFLEELPTQKGIGSTEFHVFRVDKKQLTPKFLYYTIYNGAFRTYAQVFMEGTAGQKRITTPFISNTKIPVPSIEEQKRIVEFLDRKTAEIDQAIAQKQRLIELLQEQKAILINQAVTKGLDPNVPMCDRGVDWIGKIPTHWQLDKVKHLTTKVGSGITPRGGGENYIDEGVLFIRSQNVYFDELRLDDAVYISEKTHNLMSNTSVCVGDVLLNITGASIGRNCVFRGESSKANVNQHVCIIRPNLKIRPWYLSYLFESRLGQEQIWLSQNGASREGLNFADLKTFVFPLPTIEEQKEIEKEIFKILETIKETINSIEKEKKALREFGSCLITSAVTGKIKV